MNWILTFWAVQKLGAVAVLVNPALTAEEIIKLALTGDIEFFCYGKMPAMSEPEAFLAQIMSRSLQHTACARFRGCVLKLRISTKMYYLQLRTYCIIEDG